VLQIIESMPDRAVTFALRNTVASNQQRWMQVPDLELAEENRQKAPSGESLQILQHKSD
jgi:hypothetical protein